MSKVVKKLCLLYHVANCKMTHMDVVRQLKESEPSSNLRYLVGMFDKKDDMVAILAILANSGGLEVKDPSHYQITSGNKIYKPTFETVPSFRRGIVSGLIDERYVTNFETISNGHLLNAKEFVTKEIIDKGIKQALKDHYAREAHQMPPGVSKTALYAQFHKAAMLLNILRSEKREEVLKTGSYEISESLKEWFSNPAFIKAIWSALEED